MILYRSRTASQRFTVRHYVCCRPPWLGLRGPKKGDDAYFDVLDGEDEFEKWKFNVRKRRDSQGLHRTHLAWPLNPISMDLEKE